MIINSIIFSYLSWYIYYLLFIIYFFFRERDKENTKIVFSKIETINIESYKFLILFIKKLFQLLITINL